MKKILAIIAILVLSTSIIFLFFQNQNLKKDITVLNKKIEELENKIINEKKNKDWEFFENKEYNYFVSYPKTANIGSINLDRCGNQCVDAKELFYESTFNIFVYKKPVSNNLENYVNNIFENSVATLENTKWIDIAGQKGYQITASVDYDIIYTYIVNNNYLYEINVINPDEESLIIYDKILESFKFTN